MYFFDLSALQRFKQSMTWTKYPRNIVSLCLYASKPCDKNQCHLLFICFLISSGPTVWRVRDTSQRLGVSALAQAIALKSCLLHCCDFSMPWTLCGFSSSQSHGGAVTTLSPVQQPISGFFLVMCSACALHLLACSPYHICTVAHTTSVTFVPNVCIRKCWPRLHSHWLFASAIVSLHCNKTVCISCFQWATAWQCKCVAIGTAVITDRTRHLNISSA